jgi:hypothetical protein
MVSQSGQLHREKSMNSNIAPTIFVSVSITLSDAFFCRQKKTGKAGVYYPE